MYMYVSFSFLPFSQRTMIEGWRISHTLVIRPANEYSLSIFQGEEILLPHLSLPPPK